MSGRVIERWRRDARERASRQLVALAKPMDAIPLVGDPNMTPGSAKDYLSLDPAVRVICLYAAALMQKRGTLPIDASAVDARFVPPSTVVFLAADASQAELCRLTVELVEPAAIDSEDDDA